MRNAPARRFRPKVSPARHRGPAPAGRVAEMSPVAWWVLPFGNDQTIGTLDVASKGSVRRVGHLTDEPHPSDTGTEGE
jgi:hypothetical protein